MANIAILDVPTSRVCKHEWHLKGVNCASTSNLCDKHQQIALLNRREKRSLPQAHENLLTFRKHTGILVPAHARVSIPARLPVGKLFAVQYVTCAQGRRQKNKVSMSTNRMTHCTTPKEENVHGNTARQTFISNKKFINMAFAATTSSPSLAP